MKERASAGGRVEVFVLERLRVKDLEDVDPFVGRNISSLVSLLAGHSYGLLLAASYLRRGPLSGLENRLQELQRILAEKPPYRRLDAMIEQTLRDIDKSGSGEVRELLEHLALFMEPIFRQTLGICYSEACRRTAERRRQRQGEGAETPLAELNSIIDALESECLLVKVTRTVPANNVVVPRAESAAPSHDGVALQASVRSYLRRQGREPRSAVLPDFSMTGFTSGTNGVDPGSEERQSRLDSLFGALCMEIRNEANTLDDRRELCRDAFGVLRTQIDSSTAARWRVYDSYMRLGIELTGLVKDLGEPLWAFCEPAELKSIGKSHGSLYIGELAWLYNDVGLALFCEGLMQDAYAVWEQGYEINKVLEGTQPYGEFVVESLLNLTHTFIELGKVADASEYLDKAAGLNVRLRDRQFRGRILGYQGLCEQIGGNLQRADKLYDKCAKCLRLAGNRRAMSYFLSLQAGIKVELGAFDEARDLVQSSRAFAEAVDHPDLVIYSRLPGADLLVRQNDFVGARQLYLTALEEARHCGARGLEANVYLKLANLSLEQRDPEGGRRFAIQSLKLSNELALGLLTTHALLTLARALLPTRRGLGITYLKLARRRAHEQGYGMGLREAEKYLQEAGEAGG